MGRSGDYPGFESSGTPIAPTNCATGTLSAQEKALEFMLLDLASCPSSDSNLPPVPQPSCTPLTACPPSYTCGEYPNGCGDGGFINCGTCDGGATCIDGQCKACTPLTVCPTGVTCGDVPDGCGGIPLLRHVRVDLGVHRRHLLDGVHASHGVPAGHHLRRLGQRLRRDHHLRYR